MTLPSSGQITTAQIMTEVGRTGNNFVSSDSIILSLAGKSSGQQVIIPNDFYGKTYAAGAGSDLIVSTTLTSVNPQRKVVTANPSGGTGTYTYQWTSDGDIGILGGTTNQSITAYDQTGVGVGNQASGTVYITVTSGGYTTSASRSMSVNGTGCVVSTSFLHDNTIAKDIQPGHDLLVLTHDLKSTEYSPCTDIVLGPQPCVRLVSTSGIVLECSEQTPIVDQQGNKTEAVNSLGFPVAVQDENGFRWEYIVQVISIGIQEVAKISVSDKIYAAGKEPGKLMFTHNIKAL